MRVGAVQYKARKGAPGAALREIGILAGRAAGGSDLVVLPEMASTGYLFSGPEAVRPFAEAPDGPTFAALAPIARQNRCWMVGGFVEAAGDRLFNSAIVIDPAGERRFVYRKTLLFDADLSWATPGDSGYARFDADAGAFTVGICMDLNDDAFVAWCAASGARAVAFPTNWVEEGEDVWAYWAERMEGTGAALIAANTYGPEDHVTFSGASAVLDRRTILASGPKSGNAVLRATLPP